ncbi:MAG: tRNA lysidine(34) synthetase TilS [Chloroflexi bacterium]|nr:tRNA lysidine(34) synthetase TilS [Chloroflexota bacterium]
MEPAQFLTDFHQYFKPVKDVSIVIGVSGGADSLSLAHLLLNSGLALIPAHFDHQLRIVSAAQAAEVAALMNRWGLPIEPGSGDVREFATNHKMGVEEAARVCRYEFLFSVAQKYKAQAVLTAHHLDDQVETVLMHFLRGSGINGLSGMRLCESLKQFSEEIPLWRPLLSTSKEEILDYCQRHDIEPIEDESNQELRYFRNRLRHELIPQIEKIQPSFRTIAARNARVVELDRQALERVTEQAWRDSLSEAHPGKALVFDRETWERLDEAIQYRLLMKAANTLVPGLRDLGFAELQRAKETIESRLPGKDFKAGILISNQAESFILSLGRFDLLQPEFPQLPDGISITLTLKKPAKLQHGWQISANLVDREEYENLSTEAKQAKDHAWLNPADVEWPLEVRRSVVGERWSPLGMVHKRQKMSDFLVNSKIPRAVRQAWPVVSSGGAVLWVAGLRIAQAWRLTGDETEVLHLQLIPPAVI